MRAQIASSTASPTAYFVEDPRVSALTHHRDWSDPLLGTAVALSVRNVSVSLEGKSLISADRGIPVRLLSKLKNPAIRAGYHRAPSEIETSTGRKQDPGRQSHPSQI